MTAEINFTKIKTIHMIAICGTGMGALAGILKSSGFEVTGSDQNVYPPMSTQLEHLGILIMQGYSPEHLAHKPDLVIVGNVIRRDNPEARAAIDGGFPYLSFPSALREFYLSKGRTVAVCGTHGKTTTTAMIAHTFTSAGRDPSFLVGGVMQNFGNGFQVGTGTDFIIEGDEYDTAFFDKVPKFVRYCPDWAVVANIEFDHADIYDSLEQILDAFSKLVSTMPINGVVFAGIDCENVNALIGDATCPVITFGLEKNADYHPKSWSVENGRMTFAVMENNNSLGEFECAMTGEHNLKNLLATVAVCRKAGLTAPEIRNGLSTFLGIKRRQEVRGIAGDVTVIDDFAHHPTAVSATLKALRKTYPDNRLVAVFEPRTNTSRRSFFQKQYALSFHDADLVFIAPVFSPEGIEKNMRFDPQQLVADLKGQGADAKTAPDTDTLLENLVAAAKPGDVMVLMSNGSFNGLHEKLLIALEKTEGN